MLLHRATKDIPLWKVAYRAEDRYLAPTPDAIAEMVKSLREHGQIEPIVVHQLTKDHYYLICGATRVRAAMSLSWKTIRASVVSGTDAEFKIAEIVENLHRTKVNPELRRRMKERIKELKLKQGAFLAAVEPCKGGRGKAGGVRAAARELGISSRTARRRRWKTGANLKGAPLSLVVDNGPEPPGLPPRDDDRPHRFSLPLTEREFQWLKALADQNREPIGQYGRRMLMERLQQLPPIPNSKGE
jgi:hypothetical protein